MRRALLVLALLLTACSSEPTPLPPAPQSPVASPPVVERPLPPGPDLNPYVLETMKTYPVDGSYGYYWPKEGGWEGTTRDLVYDGRKLTDGDPERRSYCCGLTFEVYVRALLDAAEGPVEGVSGDTLHELRLRFFGDSKEGERRRLCQFGLESLGLGEAIQDLEQARAGDFVQFWRHKGSGHSVIFVNWVRRKGEIAGMTYWSSQTSTQGIGYQTEWIGSDGIDREQIYVARASWPMKGSAD